MEFPLIHSLASRRLEAILASTKTSIKVFPASWSTLSMFLTASRRCCSSKSLSWPLNNAFVIFKADSKPSSPCKSRTTSSANFFCASRLPASSFKDTSKASISSFVRNVNFFKYSMTFESSVLNKNWYNSYGEVFLGSNQTVPVSLLPNLVPSAFVINGIVKP